jgi:chromate transporter
VSVPTAARRGSLPDIVRYFLRLGLLGFGGPVALVGQMERELVAERGWLTKEQMRDAIAICQSLPGPLAIQVGIYTAYLRGGFSGAWLGGWAFIFPNFVIVAALGALYVRLGDLKPITAIFYGVSPAVIALILHSCYRLAKLGMEDRLQWLIAAACLLVTVILQAEVALLFVGAGLVGTFSYGNIFQRRPPPLALPLAALPSLGQLTSATSGSTLAKLLLFFLKAGSLTFGSGLVIVPFLQQALVEQYNWLDERQFLIAVAVGMISPGPVVITATFVGYLVAGFWGSVVSTVGIFFPSFIFVLVVAPLLVRHGKNRNVQGFVRGAYAAAIGTILGACILLGRIAIGDWLTALIGAASLAVLFRFKVHNAVLIAATAVIGLIAYPLVEPAWVMVK